MPLHEDELAIDDATVAALVGRDAPHLAHLPLARLAASGSSNVLYRLGPDLLVRLPRQPGGSDTIVTEARWLPALAATLPVAVPEVVVVGGPGFGYPERWSVVRWIDGEPGRRLPGDGPVRDLAAVVRALGEAPVPGAAARDPHLRTYRGEPLATMDATTRQDLAACREVPGMDLDLDACARVWTHAMHLPGVGERTRPRWLHGDLLAENVLVRDGRLAAVLDFGGLGVGDPTVDLVVAWELLDAAQRTRFRALLDLDEPTWLRGRAWALALSVMTFPYYWSTMPGRCAARLEVARAVLADAG